MPRTAITAVTPKGPYTGAVSADDLDVAWTAADAANLQTTPWVGNRMLLQWRNSGVGANTVTITSLADGHGRLDTIATFSVGAGEYGAWLVERDGWQQSDNALYYEASDAEIFFSVLAIP